MVAGEAFYIEALHLPGCIRTPLSRFIIPFLRGIVGSRRGRWGGLDQVTGVDGLHPPGLFSGGLLLW